MLYKCDLPVIDVCFFKLDNFEEMKTFLTWYGAEKIHYSSDGVLFFTIGEEYSVEVGDAVVFDPENPKYPLHFDSFVLRETYSPQENDAAQGQAGQAGVQPGAQPGDDAPSQS